MESPAAHLIVEPASRTGRKRVVRLLLGRFFPNGKKRSRTATRYDRQGWVPQSNCAMRAATTTPKGCPVPASAHNPGQESDFAPCTKCGETEDANPRSAVALNRACPAGGACTFCACQTCWPDGIAAGDDRITCCAGSSQGKTIREAITDTQPELLPCGCRGMHSAHCEKDCAGDDAQGRPCQREIGHTGECMGLDPQPAFESCQSGTDACTFVYGDPCRDHPRPESGFDAVECKDTIPSNANTGLQSPLSASCSNLTQMEPCGGGCEQCTQGPLSVSECKALEAERDALRAALRNQMNAAFGTCYCDSSHTFKCPYCVSEDLL